MAGLLPVAWQLRFKSLSAIGEMLPRYGMVRSHGEPATKLATWIQNAQIVQDEQLTIVKADMVIWTETQYVFRRVRAIMWSPERPNVCPFRVGASCRLNLLTTDLAGVVIKPLHCLYSCCAANLALHFNCSAHISCRLTIRRRKRGSGLRALRLLHQSVTPDAIPGPSLFVPVCVHEVEAIVSIATAGREASVAARPTHNPHRKTVHAAQRERKVSGHKLLIGNLLT